MKELGQCRSCGYAFKKRRERFLGMCNDIIRCDENKKAARKEYRRKHRLIRAKKIDLEVKKLVIRRQAMEETE